MTRRDVRCRRRGGAVLLVVALAIATVGAVAYLVYREATLQLHLGAASGQDEQALHVAEAGIAHGLWYAKNVQCGPSTPLVQQPLGPHHYDLQLTDLAGGRTRIDSIGTLANGVQRQRRVEVEVPGGDDETLVLPPVADVYIHTDDHNDGTKLDHHVKRSLSQAKIENALLRFELPVTSRWVVTRSRLELSLFGWNKDADPLPGGGPVAIAARGVTQDWLEGAGDSCPCSGAIWTSYDGNPAHTWATPGGDFLPGQLDPQLVEQVGRYDWDVTSLTTDWADGTRANQGVALTALYDLPDQAKFRSREYVFDPGEPGQPPVLVVDFACPCGAVCRTTYRDEFSQRLCVPGDADWSGSDGTLNADWSPNPWSLSHPGLHSCNGNVRIATAAGDHHLHVSGDGDSIERSADLSAHSQARLKFDYTRVGMTGGRFADVEVSGDGGASWQLLRRIIGSGTDTAPKQAEFDISDYRSADTRIRFTALNLVGAGAPAVEFDDVQIDEEAASPPPPPPLVLSPVADAYLDENHVNSNEGDANPLSMKNDSGESRRGVLRFDLAAIPADYVLDAAVLRLWIDDNRSDAPGANLLVYRLLEGWEELQVTWRHHTTQLWSTPGGTVANPAVNQLFIDDSFKEAWAEIDITPLVQGWIDGVTPDHGVRVDTDQNKEIKVSSREAAAEERPQLVLTWQ